MPEELPGLTQINRVLEQIEFADGLLYAGISIPILTVLIALFAFATSRKVKLNDRHHLTSRIIYSAFLATVAVLAVSAFGAIWTDGHMLGYPLLMHIAAAGGFVFLLLAIALLYLPRGQARRIQTEHRWWLARATAWTMVLASIVTAASMFLSMLPILGTDGLHEAAAIHRWAGLTVVIATVLHFTSLCCTRFGFR